MAPMTPKPALTNAVKMMKESCVDAVKLQGGQKMFDIIKAVADASVPVMSHTGLLTHYMQLYGGFKIQGRTAKDALIIIDNARDRGSRRCGPRNRGNALRGGEGCR